MRNKSGMSEEQAPGQLFITLAFPSLAADGYTLASPKTQAHNCVAWAAGDASRWWEPGIFWPGPTGDDLAALTGLFAARGYVPCAGDELEAGYEKAALYADDQGNWTHAALQLPDGWWTSKLGPDEDILHRTHWSASSTGKSRSS